MKKKRTKPMTAAEAMEILNKDEDYQRRKAEKYKLIEERKRIRDEEAKPLVAELKSVGVEVQSVWDLVNTGMPYPEAIPVLLKHLRYAYADRTREGIARALAVPEAKDAWEILVEEFEKNPDQTGLGLKFGLGCALAVVAAVTHRYEEAIELMRDERHGQNRAALIDVLALSRDPEIRLRLKEFVDDPVLGDDARWSLKHPGRRRS